MNRNQIKISVIIPAYNVDCWLARCLDSVVCQTHENLEIIVIDDGSTDKTREIIESYARKDNRIIPIYQSNQGLVETREEGIKRSTGQYVGFVDGDDEIIPEMYEKLLENIVKYNADISHCGILYCFGDGRRKSIHGTGCLLVQNHDESVKELLRGDRVEPSLCCKLYSRNLLIDSCLDKTVVNNEDLLRNFVLFDRANCTVFEDFCGYLYWRREASMSNNQNRVKIWTHMIKARKLIAYTCSHTVKDDADRLLLKAYIGAYKALDKMDENDATCLKEECRSSLRKDTLKLSGLNKKEKVLRFLIVYFPNLFSVLHDINQAKAKRQRVKLSERAQEET